MFCHLSTLTIKNKMSEGKKMFDTLNLVGSVTLAFSIPWIIFRVFRAVYLKRRYNELVGKVVCCVLGRRQELDRVNDLLHTHCTVQTHPPIIIPLDLSDLESLPGHIEKIISITGHIDILINNGGVSHRGTVISTTLDVDVKIMQINYFGSVTLTKAVLPSMIKRRKGHIIFTSSVQGLVALPERSAYSASKHALQAFSDSLRAK
ncbi:hypothetical protein NQ317_016139 [Molorchus minor]|uniref:Uncharacterized protein n=1 Tax=Molorchus minor TaxID=1323400 RepID=A0ABQ9J0A6_9CUCU|nr:hypothetical protein NQ317_016139 [Molorchus minor]